MGTAQLSTCIPLGSELTRSLSILSLDQDCDIFQKVCSVVDPGRYGVQRASMGSLRRPQVIGCLELRGFRVGVPGCCGSQLAEKAVRDAFQSAKPCSGVVTFWQMLQRYLQLTNIIAGTWRKPVTCCRDLLRRCLYQNFDYRST